MYIQITTRCQMSCQHCCFNCTAKGNDMTVEAFRKLLKIANNNDEDIVIGGGEPTIHPDFELLLMFAIAETVSNERLPLIITNGGFTDKALLIAKLTKMGLVNGELSQDCFHDPIDCEVMDAFADIEHGYRDVTHDHRGLWRDPELLAGREIKRRGLIRPKVSCPCDTTFVKPNGKIYQCGCSRSPCIGDAETGFHTDCSGGCYRSEEYKRERHFEELMAG